MSRTLHVTLFALLTGCVAQGAGLVDEFAGPPGSGEPHLVDTRDGRAILTWFEPAGTDSHALRAAVRGPDAWGEPSDVVIGDAFFVNWADFPSLTELSDGTWLVHWLETTAETPYAYHVKLAFSRDEGASWSAPLVPHRDSSASEHGFVSVVPWGVGGAALIWLDGRRMGAVDLSQGEPVGDMMLRFTTVTRGGELSPDVTVDRRVCECCTTALARTERGLLAAYRDRTSDEIRDIAVTRYEGGVWSEPVVVADDGWRITGCPVNGPQLAARGDQVALVWFTAADDRPRVQISFSTDGGHSWRPPGLVDDGAPLGRVDVVMMVDGSAVVGWLEATDDGAEVRARRFTTRGARERSYVVGGTENARAAGFPRMARVADEVLFAWTVPDQGVRVASRRF